MSNTNATDHQLSPVPSSPFEYQCFWLVHRKKSIDHRCFTGTHVVVIEAEQLATKCSQLNPSILVNNFSKFGSLGSLHQYVVSGSRNE